MTRQGATRDDDRIRRLQTRTADDAPLVMMTAYDALSAQIADECGVDFVLVGDSAATTVLGYENTRDVTIEEMLMLTRAARRGTRNALLVGDLPFGTYESSDDLALETALRFRDAGCDMLKLEGGGRMRARVQKLADAGIPMVGHVGLLPQGAQSQADLKARGRTAAEAVQIVRDAIELEQAGASLLVVEAVPAAVGAVIAKRVRIPVIGIGAGAEVDGQVLVYTDVLGLGAGHVPKFVRSYADARSVWTNALSAYVRDVRAHAFPTAAETYGMSDDERARFDAALTAAPPTA